MSLTRITCPSCGASAAKYIPFEAKFATCHKCGHRFDVWKEGFTPSKTDIEEKNLPPSHSNSAMDSSSGGWLKLALIYTVCIYSFLFVMVANNTRHSPGWPNSLEILVSLLYVPTILITVAVCLTLIVSTIKTRQVFRHIFPLMLCVPMIAYSFYNPGQAYDKSYFERMDKIEANDKFKIEMAKALDTYYATYPERFHYIGTDCEVSIDGFADYVKANYKKARDYGAKFKKDKIIDPLGAPVRYVRDRYNDRIIRANGVVAGIPYWSGGEIDNPEGLGIINSIDDGRHEPFSVLMNEKYRAYYDVPKEIFICDNCGMQIVTKLPKNATVMLCQTCGGVMEKLTVYRERHPERFTRRDNETSP